MIARARLNFACRFLAYIDTKEWFMCTTTLTVAAFRGKSLSAQKIQHGQKLFPEVYVNKIKFYKIRVKKI